MGANVGKGARSGCEEVDTVTISVGGGGGGKGKGICCC